MSRQGMKAALQYGEQLPAYSSASEAESFLFQLKDSTLEALISEHGLAIGLDYSSESLKRLEKWYFEVGCPKAGVGGYSMTHAIGFYLGEVYCRAADFCWIVKEFPFKNGHFEIGINRRLLSIMLTKGKAPAIDGNKRMQSLWREYRLHAV
ncbi:hypothetical protein [Paraglaciecola sp.]|uniref:hypothetical protein n=1 Tax=Paraglaciecola sp. TaxID=1920173 RepID=UPI0030F382F8